MLEAFADYPHCRDAYIYAQHVVNGHRPACQQERQAAQRFLDNLVSEELAFDFDPVRAERVCRFIELLPHTKGRWAAKGERISLEPWQKFIVVNLFGWIDENDKRRFRRAYVRVPRKNGKSLLAACIGLYMLVADDEFGAEVYSGATTEKQAWEVFRPARLICARTPDLVQRFGIEVNAKALAVIANGATFQPVIGNPGDGPSPSCAIVDEYHEHKSSELVDTMETGMGAREQPLLLEITTSGSNLGGPCYLAELEYKKILDRVYDEPRVFAIMYGLDPEDDWTQPEALEKANPNYDVSVAGEWLRAQQQTAIRVASRQNAFRRKHLNTWVGAHTAWMNMESWHRCADPALDIAEWAGQPCVFAVDLASRIDLTAFLQVFGHTGEDGKRHYTVFPRFYLPEETVYTEANSHYQAWVASGHIVATEGEEIDFNEIERDIVEELGKYSVGEVVYDPWRATQLAQGLAKQGATPVEFRNTVNQMSPAMYELEAAITSGRLHHADHPVMNWMMSNVVAKIDAKDNIYPRKERPESKIDGVVALIMAVGRLMVQPEPKQAPGILWL